MRSNLLFTSMAVVSLALGIGANAAHHAARIAGQERRRTSHSKLANENRRSGSRPCSQWSLIPGAGGGIQSPDFPWQAYELLRNHNNYFAALFAYKDAGRLNLIVNGQAEAGSVEYVSGNFFSGLGINPAVGRLLADGDDLAGSSQVAVISIEYWRKRFNTDPSAIGKTIKLNNIPFAIAGVAAPEFYGVSAGSAPLVYIPMFNRLTLVGGIEGKAMFVDHSYWVDIMGRLRAGVTLARAEAELSRPFHQYLLAAAVNDQERADLPALWLRAAPELIHSAKPFPNRYGFS